MEERKRQEVEISRYIKYEGEKRMLTFMSMRLMSSSMRGSYRTFLECLFMKTLALTARGLTFSTMGKV